MRKASGGFTLIELIVVIVILGILAVTAAPKFIDLQSDARIATINGMKAALNSAISLTYGKSLVQGLEKKDNGTLTVNGKNVTLVYGYPKGKGDDLKNVLDLGDTFAECGSDTKGDWCYKEDDNTGVVTLYLSNGYEENKGCNVKYTQARGTTNDVNVLTVTPPTVVPETTGC